MESRTRVEDTRTGRSETFYQCGACRSEHTFAERGLFMKENYDFLPIFGPEEGLVFRRRAAAHARYRETRSAGDLWDGQIYHLVMAAAPRELISQQEIAATTHSAVPLVATTELEEDSTGLRAVIEYPVKTMNIRDADDFYQVDTGPVAWPDLSEKPDRMVDRLSLAFIAFNATGFADFVIEDRTRAGAGTEVYHYSRLVSLDARNRLFAAPRGASSA